MPRHYRYSQEIATSTGPQRRMRLACGTNPLGALDQHTPALKYSDIVPSGITCKRCLQTWVVRHHSARVLNIDPASKTMDTVIARYGEGAS